MMRKIFSVLSGICSLLLTLVVVAFSAATIADTIGWRLNSIEDTPERPAMIQSQFSTETTDQP